MKKLWIGAMCALVLSACAANGGSGNSEVYGVITGGVETSKNF